MRCKYERSSRGVGTKLMVLTDEILGDSRALWTSPDNKFIAYIRFDDSAVPTARIPLYDDPDNIYGRFVDIPYPKVRAIAAQRAAKNNTVNNEILMFISTSLATVINVSH